MDTLELKSLVEAAGANTHTGTGASSPPPAKLHAAVEEILARLDAGTLRVATPPNTDANPTDAWVFHPWVRQAILLYFGQRTMQLQHFGAYSCHDKIPLKTALVEQKIRLVPPGAVRYGAFLEPGCVVMPGYVNIGAYVGAGSMVDTWATVGSCAQIGRDVHLSGGVGIGGVLEPIQAAPVIVEDGAFIGSRCVVVEGVRIGKEAVLGAAVTLTASTPIIDVTQKQEVVYRGHVPPRSVVVAGSRSKNYSAGTYALPCALIIGQRAASTDRKTTLNQVLRQFDEVAG